MIDGQPKTSHRLEFTLSENDFAKLTDTELETMVKSAHTSQRVIIGIFAIIILAWIFLGYWQTNTPVFVITVALAGVLIATVSTRLRLMSAEWKKRQQP